MGWKKDMFCHQTVEVWGGFIRIIMWKVGRCLSAWFVFDQQNIHGIIKEEIREIKKMSRMCWSKTCKQLNLWQDSLLWRLSKFKCLTAKHVMSGSDPIRICFFVLCPRLDAPDGTSVDTICRLNMLLVFFSESLPSPQNAAFPNFY